jgi:uncharacterized Tic20 family protein
MVIKMERIQMTAFICMVIFVFCAMAFGELIAMSASVHWIIGAIIGLIVVTALLLSILCAILKSVKQNNGSAEKK